MDADNAGEGGRSHGLAAGSPSLAQRRGRRDASSSRPGHRVLSSAPDAAPACDLDAGDAAEGSDGGGEPDADPGAGDEPESLFADAVTCAVEAAARNVKLRDLQLEGGEDAEPSSEEGGEENVGGLSSEMMQLLQYETILQSIEGGNQNRLKNYLSDWTQYKVTFWSFPVLSRAAVSQDSTSL